MIRVSVGTVATGGVRKAPRLRRAAPWLGGLVLVAGVIVALVLLTGNKDAPKQATASTPVPTTSKPAAKPKTVPLSKEAQGVAREFVRTAVARQDLAKAWLISGPLIRGGLTHKEWMTGNIPVVPYPIDQLKFAPFKIDYSYADHAGIEIALLPKTGAKIKPQVFNMELRRVAGPDGTRRWLVETWVPHSAPLVPRAGG